MDLVQIKGQSSDVKLSKIRAISEKTGVHEAFVMLLVEISPVLEADVRDKARSLNVSLDELSQSELNYLLLSGIGDHFKGRSKDDLQDFASYLGTGVSKTPRRALEDRQWLREHISESVELVLGRNVGGLSSVESQLRPIVKKLGREALDAVSDVDLSAKDKVQLFEKLAKLQAQVSGELVERKQLEVGPTEMFKEIMMAAKGMNESERKGIQESVDARWELVE